MNRNCSSCNTKMNINNKKKDRTVGKNCHKKIKEKMKLQFRTNNQKMKTVRITITLEHYWLALVFGVKHN